MSRPQAHGDTRGSCDATLRPHRFQDGADGRSPCVGWSAGSGDASTREGEEFSVSSNASDDAHRRPTSAVEGSLTSPARPLSSKQELRYLTWIVKRVMRLSDPSKSWLMSYLMDELGMRPQGATADNAGRATALPTSGSLVRPEDGGSQ